MEFNLLVNALVKHLILSLNPQGIDENGHVPNPYDENLVLNLEIMPKWTLPDLGDEESQ